MDLPVKACSRIQSRSEIDTLCALREAEAASTKCASRADRSLNLGQANARLRALDARCESLRRQLQTVRAPPSGGASRRFVESRFDRGQLAVPAAAMPRTSHAETVGVARVFPGWYTAASRVRDLSTMRRVLEYVRARHRPSEWNAMQVRANPHLAVPRFISTKDEHMTLQNLPAWQSARLTLLACAMHNRRSGITAAGLERWLRALGVHSVYAPKVRELRCSLRST